METTMTTTKKSKRGGARKGAGRKQADPLLKKERAHIMLPKWMLVKLAELDQGRNDATADALCEKFGWTPPNQKKHKETDN